MSRTQLIERLQALSTRFEAEATRVSKEGFAKDEPYRSNVIWHVRRDMADLVAVVVDVVKRTS